MHINKIPDENRIFSYSDFQTVTTTKNGLEVIDHQASINGNWQSIKDTVDIGVHQVAYWLE